MAAGVTAWQHRKARAPLPRCLHVHLRGERLSHGLRPPFLLLGDLQRLRYMDRPSWHLQFEAVRRKYEGKTLDQFLKAVFWEQVWFAGGGGGCGLNARARSKDLVAGSRPPGRPPHATTKPARPTGCVQLGCAWLRTGPAVRCIRPLAGTHLAGDPADWHRQDPELPSSQGLAETAAQGDG